MRSPVVPATEAGMALDGTQVRCLLRGEAIETRRVASTAWPADLAPSEHSQQPGYWLPYGADGRLKNGLPGTLPDDCGVYAPHKVGDVPWIAEDFRLRRAPGDHWVVTYEADNQQHVVDPAHHREAVSMRRKFVVERWAPAVGMSATFARTVRVQVVAVRVERLQAVTTDGVRASGYHDWTHRVMGLMEGRRAFANAWDNQQAGVAGASWSDNPWVFVTTARAVLAIDGAPAVPYVRPVLPPMSVEEAEPDALAFKASVQAIDGISTDQVRAYMRLYGNVLADDPLMGVRPGAADELRAGFERRWA